MEYWGIKSGKNGSIVFIPLYPSFQYSITPLFQLVFESPFDNSFFSWYIFLDSSKAEDVIVKSWNQTAKKKDPDARRANPEEWGIHRSTLQWRRMKPNAAFRLCSGPWACRTADGLFTKPSMLGCVFQLFYWILDISRGDSLVPSPRCLVVCCPNSLSLTEKNFWPF